MRAGRAGGATDATSSAAGSWSATASTGSSIPAGLPRALALCGDGVYGDHTPAAGMVTGIVLAKYDEESSALYASARLWGDGIVDAPDTRDVLGPALVTALRAPIPPPRHGIVRM